MPRLMWSRDPATGQLVSREGDQFAWPILDYSIIAEDFTAPLTYHLEKIKVFSVGPQTYNRMEGIGPGRLTAAEKNPHRIFWGMKPLKEKA